MKKQLKDLLLDAIDRGYVVFGKPMYVIGEGKQYVIGRVWLVDGSDLDNLDRDNPNADYDSYLVAWHGTQDEMFEKKDPFNTKFGAYQSVERLRNPENITNKEISNFLPLLLE